MVLKNLETILDLAPYSLSDIEKKPLFRDAIKEVTMLHYRNCALYRKLCDKRGFNPALLQEINDLIYLPTSLFKDTLLLSIPEDQIFREINSSATTSGRPSRMALDKQTSKRQSKCFNKVIIDRLGNKRRNFIVLDTPGSIGKSTLVSARGSTIRSLLFYAKRADTCIENVDGKLVLDLDKLDTFLTETETADEEIVIFGFTYVLYNVVLQGLAQAGRRYHLPGSKVIHIGGWKKLEKEKVSSDILTATCSDVFGVHKTDIIDIYGFTEQSGMVYPTCEAGFRHVPVWGDVIVREPITLEPLPSRETGLLQFVTPIQTSYPGHSVLTEDVGYVEAVDQCDCGRKGKTFKVIGRSSVATELRGCGDIMAEKFA